MNTCLKYFLNLLGKKDYSEGELRFKAETKNYSQTEIEEAIAYLKSRSFLDEKRMAENILNHYAGNKGQMWIKQKMQTKKIPTGTIAEILQNQEITANDKLKQKLETKYKIEFSNWLQVDFNTKQKILAFLLRRGFTSPNETIKKWISKD